MAAFIGQPVTYLQAWDFVVEIGGIGVAGFTAATGIEKETKAAIQMEGGIPTPVDVSTTTTNYKPITLRRGSSNNAELYEWSKAAEESRQDKRDVSIVQQYGGVPAVRWNCEQCVLLTYKGPEFDRGKEEENGIEEIVIQPLRWKRVAIT